MKFVIVALALIAGCSAASIIDRSLDGFWEEFKELHGKQYLNSEEEALRYIYKIHINNL